MIISPSLLAADFSKLGQELADLEAAGLSWVHWDVMDGNFVPNITMGPPIIKALRQKSSLFFDVHLMIQQPERYLQEFIDAGANLLTVQLEACLHLERTLSEIRRLGCKCGVALNPHTPLCMLEHVLEDIDVVLIMSVNPGFGGQSLLSSAVPKIQKLQRMINECKAKTIIEVDGGVNLENTPLLVAAGAEALVSGSAFFSHPPYKERLTRFQEAANSL